MLNTDLLRCHALHRSGSTLNLVPARPLSQLGLFTLIGQIDLISIEDTKTLFYRICKYNQNVYIYRWWAFRCQYTQFLEQKNVP